MNRNGFTLIEIIGVIAIIAILGIVTIPIVTGVLSDSSNKIDKAQEKLIIGAARSYAVENAFTIKDVDCVKVSDLVEYGYLDNSTENTYDSYGVTIEKNGNSYKYVLSESGCD